MNLIDLASDAGIDVKEAGQHRHVREGWIGFDCPFCGEGTKKFHLGYNLSSGVFTCWKCGKHSKLPTLKALFHLQDREAYKISRQLKTTHLPTSPQRERRGLHKPKGLGPLLKAHKRYLTKRGFDPEQLEALWNLQATSLHPSLPWKIYIPITFHNQEVSWTTRSIGPTGIRYHSASPAEESINHKTLLYGEELCGHTCIVHEGPIDVWRTGPGAVAIFGAYPSPAQIRKISKHPIRVICLDSDRTSQKNANSLCRDLEVFPGTTYKVVLETGKDIAEASDSEVKELQQYLR